MTVTLGSDGWTNITESSDTHKIYVSSSTGNDATAVVGDINHPYQTLSAAMAQVRDGYPDWVLLKAGDTWVDQSFGNLSVSGRSADEPLLLSSYGSGARPLIETNSTNAVGIGTNNGVAPHAANNIAVVGLEFYAYTRDPSNPNFAGASGNDQWGIDNLNHFDSFSGRRFQIQFL